MLMNHYSHATIIIIDEYDTPIQQGYTEGYYEEVVGFMRNLFSGAFKDNKNLAYGFLTGILFVAKGNILSGLNNLKLNSILEERYSEYFGFTKTEISSILKYYERTDKYDEICEWYDGYYFGNAEIFNPWSVVNYIDNECIAKPFWASTSSNDIIGEMLSFSTSEINKSLYKLLNNETIITLVDTNVIYPELHKNEYYIYSFLLITGYLKIVKIYPQDNGSNLCEVAIPNKEIKHIYEKEILDKNNYNSVAISIQEAIFMEDEKKLEEAIEKFMIKSISFYDGANESFFSRILLCLCIALSNCYYVKSNGEGFDIQLFPKKNNIPGFIFEFKHAKNETIDLDILASEALNQIDLKKCDREMILKKTTNIIKIGIAFFGKKVVVKRS